MTVQVIAALVAGITSIVVLTAGHLLTIQLADRQKKSQINSQYLNPLRLYVEEVYYRLYEINHMPKSHNWLLSIQHERELSDQEEDWYTSEGCYLVSSCYFTACLFASIVKVREDIPYLRLARNSDTELLRLTFLISKALLRESGIFYALQHNIGKEMYRDDDLISYKEFCKILKDPKQRLWFDRLVKFYLDLGKVQLLAAERASDALSAMWDLGEFIDRSVQGGKSIETRLISELKVDPLSPIKKATRFFSANRYPRPRNPSLAQPSTAHRMARANQTTEE